MSLPPRTGVCAGLLVCVCVCVCVCVSCLCGVLHGCVMSIYVSQGQSFLVVSPCVVRITVSLAVSL